MSEIFNELVQLGNVYNIDIDEQNFYAIDHLHSLLLEVYGGPYPFADIIANV